MNAAQHLPSIVSTCSGSVTFPSGTRSVWRSAQDDHFSGYTAPRLIMMFARSQRDRFQDVTPESTAPEEIVGRLDDQATGQKPMMSASIIPCGYHTYDISSQISMRPRVPLLPARRDYRFCRWLIRVVESVDSAGRRPSDVNIEFSLTTTTSPRATSLLVTNIPSARRASVSSMTDPLSQLRTHEPHSGRSDLAP